MWEVNVGGNPTNPVHVHAEIVPVHKNHADIEATLILENHVDTGTIHTPKNHINAGTVLILENRVDVVIVHVRAGMPIEVRIPQRSDGPITSLWML